MKQKEIDDTKSWEREGFSARVNALRLAEKAIREQDPGGPRAAHRISQSLRLSETAYKHPEISEIASTIEDAQGTTLTENLKKAIPKLREWASQLPAKTASVLLVGIDQEMCAALAPRLAGPNRLVQIAETRAAAEKILTETDVALVVLDLALPDGDGRDLLLRLRQRTYTANLPVLILSGDSRSQTQAECFALGADIYFPKPVDPVIIATAVAAKLQRVADLAQRSAQDPLTHLPNRTAFATAFTHARMLASRSHEPLSIAILDLDRFKSVNDIYGHAMGDRVLRRLAAVLTKSLRASDLLARWGGEEFAIFFPNTDIAEARLALSKALAAFRDEKFSTKEGRALQVTFSAGVAQVKDGMTAELAIAEADRFLYLAKSTGRDQVLTETDDVTALKRNILLVEDDELTASIIKHYLRRDGFRILHAKEGPAALTIAADTSISLITLDVKIPGIDGFELLRRFRQVPSLRPVPILMLTSAGRQEDIVRGFQLGADDYIIKPFSPRELLARVHRFLQSNNRPRLDTVVQFVLKNRRELTSHVPNNHVTTHHNNLRVARVR